MKVVIVDDSLTVRMDLLDAFEDAGLDALACATIAEARETLERERADVLVLDVLLPDGEGTDFLSEIRETPQGRNMGVLLLSTEADVKDRIRGLKRGADEYVGKPYDTKHVIGAVRKLRRSADKTADRAADQTGDRSSSVLLIDDSLTFREAMGEAFRDAGYSVVTAETGEEGLRLVADRRPHVVVVDGELPGMDGAAVIRRIRLDGALRGIPCILLTGSESKSAELSALEAGADAFVRKDEQIEVVLARTAAVLRSAEPMSNEISSLDGPHKVLAVDDSPTFLHGVADMLRDEGYDVVLAHSGEEALDLLAVQPVDCILLDLIMPGLGGKEACRQIKTTPTLRDTPLILLTSVEDRGTMLEGLSAGADDYIAKSSEFSVLKARVRAQIRRKQFEDENRRIREELMRKEMDAAEARAAQQLAEARAALAAELERKNKELEAFSYSVSHDLRAPLRTIVGFSEAVMEDHGGVLDEEGLDGLRRICAAGKRMSNLIDDMLQLSQVTSQDIGRTRIDLSRLASEVVEGLRLPEPERDIEIAIEADVFVEADERMLRIVLENLIGNAWKFTRKAEKPHIAFGVRRHGEEDVYFVSDNGAGFDMKQAEKLFRPFQRLHTNAEFPGTGIGLATIQRVIDRFGGRVWADSKVGEGTTFSFTLPAAAPAASTSSAA